MSDIIPVGKAGGRGARSGRTAGTAIGGLARASRHDYKRELEDGGGPRWPPGRPMAATGPRSRAVPGTGIHETEGKTLC